MYIEIQLEC